jgi:hypothetical protein
MENALFKNLTEGEKDTCSLCQDWNFSISCKNCPLRNIAIARTLRLRECGATIGSDHDAQSKQKKRLRFATLFPFGVWQRAKRAKRLKGATTTKRKE